MKLRHSIVYLYHLTEVIVQYLTSMKEKKNSLHLANQALHNHSTNPAILFELNQSQPFQTISKTYSRNEIETLYCLSIYHLTTKQLQFTSCETNSSKYIPLHKSQHLNLLQVQSASCLFQEMKIETLHCYLHILTARKHLATKLLNIITPQNPTISLELNLKYPPTVATFCTACNRHRRCVARG